MEEKKIITLDLTDCKYLGELHERIRLAFNFPEWYGANLSAFDDLMSTECDADELVILGVNTLTKELSEYMTKVKNILDKVVREREYYKNLYNDVEVFSYHIEN